VKKKNTCANTGKNGNTKNAKTGVTIGVSRHVFNKQMCDAIMAMCSIAGACEGLRAKVRQRLDYARSHGLQKHIADVKDMAAFNGVGKFTNVGETFLHIDMRSGIVILITVVRESHTSPCMHVISTRWDCYTGTWRTTSPHGWSDYSRNALCQHDVFELGWSHTGYHAIEHVYMQCNIKNNLDAMVAPNASRLLVPIYVGESWQGTRGLTYTGQASCVCA